MAWESKVVAIGAPGEGSTEKLRRIAEQIRRKGGSVSLQGEGARCLLIARLPRDATLTEEAGTIVIECEPAEGG